MRFPRPIRRPREHYANLDERFHLTLNAHARFAEWPHEVRTMVWESVVDERRLTPGQHKNRRSTPGVGNARVPPEGVRLAPAPVVFRFPGPLGPTSHSIEQGDARNLETIPSQSVHLVVTSPPYGSLKQYPAHENQLGNIESYAEFLSQMDRVLAEIDRVLVPGGRACLVVGDICLSRRKAGRHHVLPLPSDLQVKARSVGLDVLTPIMWFKVANISLEASRSSRFLGKPYLPGGVIKNDRETIVLLRKPGAYRKPTPQMEAASRIAKDDYFRWFSPIWTDVTGASTRVHPAPYPVEIPRRLVAMFSFAGDLVVDPFGGTGSTSEAAALLGRNSISIDIEPGYESLAKHRLEALLNKLTPPLAQVAYGVSRETAAAAG